MTDEERLIRELIAESSKGKALPRALGLRSQPTRRSLPSALRLIEGITGSGGGAVPSEAEFGNYTIPQEVQAQRNQDRQAILRNEAQSPDAPTANMARREMGTNAMNANSYFGPKPGSHQIPPEKFDPSSLPPAMQADMLKQKLARSGLDRNGASPMARMPQRLPNEQVMAQASAQPPQQAMASPLPPDAIPGGGVKDAGALPQATGYADLMKRFADKRTDLAGQLTTAEVPPNYSALQQAAQQRGRQALPQSMAAVMYGMGPRAAQGLAPGAAAQAQRYNAPTKVEGGQILPDGTMMMDPAYQQNKKVDGLKRRIDALDKLESQTVDRQMRAEIARQKAADHLELKRLAAGPSGAKQGTLTLQGKTADGRDVLLDNRRGLMTIDSATGGRTPFKGPFTPKQNIEPSATTVRKMAENRAGLSEIKRALTLVKGNREAVGAVGFLPQPLSQYIPGKSGAGGVDVRAAVADITSKIIHDRAGANTTVYEVPRLRPFIPDIARDSPATIIRKLELFQEKYEELIREIESGYPLSSVLGERGGAAAPPSAKGEPPLNDAERAELARLEAELAGLPK